MKRTQTAWIIIAALAAILPAVPSEATTRTCAWYTTGPTHDTWTAVRRLPDGGASPGLVTATVTYRRADGTIIGTASADIPPLGLAFFQAQAAAPNSTGSIEVLAGTTFLVDQWTSVTGALPGYYSVACG